MIYNYDDLLIVGDSFCMNRDSMITWPYVLLKFLTGKNERDVRGRGFGGCSWWSARVELLKELENGLCPKILIMTHTEPSRIPSDYNLPLNASTVFDDSFPKTSTYPINESAKSYFTSKNDIILFSDEVKLAGQLYYKYFSSGQFNEWAIFRWFDELDNIILTKYRIPLVIHLYSFEIHYWTRTTQRYLFKNGVTSDESLFALQHTIDEKERSIKDKNHFPEQYNYTIASQLYNFIKNYNSDMNGKLVSLNLLGR